MRDLQSLGAEPPKTGSPEVREDGMVRRTVEVVRPSVFLEKLVKMFTSWIYKDSRYVAHGNQTNPVLVLVVTLQLVI